MNAPAPKVDRGTARFLLDTSGRFRLSHSYTLDMVREPHPDETITEPMYRLTATLSLPDLGVTGPAAYATPWHWVKDLDRLFDEADYLLGARTNGMPWMYFRDATGPRRRAPGENAQILMPGTFTISNATERNQA